MEQRNTVKSQLINPAYWSQTPDDLFLRFESGRQGLNKAQAQRNGEIYGLNRLKPPQSHSALRLFLRQFRDPLILILIFAVCISVLAGEWVDAAVIAIVVFSTAILSFIQEYNATTALDKLLARVEINAAVLRDKERILIPVDRVVPGDIVLLSGGNLIPGDGIILEAKNCYVDQAALTGETFPVEKVPGVVSADASIADRTNCVFLGTSVRSGTATALMVETGARTEFGQIAEFLTHRPPETEFERGTRHFGYLLAQMVLVFVVFVFAINVLAEKPAIDSLLFAIALAVGMAPELLPAIITITLAKGAQQMAANGVIVRRLNAIENFGSMDVLCTDKTGTLTQGAIQLSQVFDSAGNPSDEVSLYAFLNARFQAGIHNPLDDAILADGKRWEPAAAKYRKLDEIPYDFARRLLSIVVETPQGQAWLITKGALDNLLDICARVQAGSSVYPLDSAYRSQIHHHFTEWSSQGFRVLGLAAKPVLSQSAYSNEVENDQIFCGFLLFFDPPKSDVRNTLADLSRLGVQLKIITGDNLHVTRYIAAQVGLPNANSLTGAQLTGLRDEALWPLVEKTTLFAELDPNQKERIIRALQKMGHVVGFMGDGINDVPALHVADVGISVNQAVDVAKEAADFVLLENSLKALQLGVVNGRKIFANTLKYVFTTTSANFGNMFSMAGLSLFLPFLPLLAKQILLNNFLSDIPGIAIVSDNVDEDMVTAPHRWDIKFIRNFMVIFGLVSSLFDYVTFGLLLWIVQSSPEQFRTSWFVESLLTELVIALVVRTRHSSFRSRPGKWLLISTVSVGIFTLLLPYLPLNTLFGFVPLPLSTMLLLLGVTALYVITAEITKKFFYARVARTVTTASL